MKDCLFLGGNLNGKFVKKENLHYDKEIETRSGSYVVSEVYKHASYGKTDTCRYVLHDLKVNKSVFTFLIEESLFKLFKEKNEDVDVSVFDCLISVFTVGDLQWD